MQKNDAQMSNFFCRKKSSKSLKKNFKNKNPSNICAYNIFKTVCGNFLKINRSRDI